MLRIVVSSRMARYSGLARAIAAPPRPSAPWQPAQFCAYRVPKSTTWLGAPCSELAFGSPCEVLQAASITRLSTASAERVLIHILFISGSPRSLAVASFREPRFLHVTQ